MEKRIARVRLGAVLILTIIIAACGDTDQTDTPPNNAPEDGVQEETDNNDTGNEAGSESTTEADTNAPYNFTEFELEADFNDIINVVDVEYDYETHDTEAEYKNKSENIDLKGNEAMEELDAIFTAFNFDENTPDEEVLNTVMEAFNIPENADSVQLEIEFADGSEKEYHQ
ncbi:YusW family protein [Virgibacillus sp. C22-A2]|uniref:YusW family protein n=1 Tax=Virgibacillus tibetensis TaxID=3042313 RepID=A0ABU6KK98_9BACI|nr:YusW family protein [Virgibacillus sp. C22-A2]